MTTRLRRPILIALLAVAAAPGAAQASTSGDIHRECQTGTISPGHSAAELAAALRSIPADLDEYTDCRDVIRRARLDGPGARKSSGAEPRTGAVSGDGATPPGATSEAGGTAKDMVNAATPAERDALDDATREPSAPVEIAGQQLSPTAAGSSPTGAANAVPAPLVVAILLLGLGLACGGLTSIRNLVRARRTAGS